MNNIITINKENKVLVGKIIVKNPDLLNKTVNSMLATIPKEKIKRSQVIALSIVLKGLLNNPKPETKKQNCIYEALTNESLESIWDDCMKVLNIKDEDKNYSMLHTFNDMFEDGILGFETLEEIDAKNQNIVTSRNAMQVFNNSNAIGKHIASQKRRKK